MIPSDDIAGIIELWHDAFGDAAENGAYLAVINRGAAQARYRADCSAAGCGTVEGTAEPVSAKIIRIT